MDINSKDSVTGWDQAHLYSPAPRHRRRIILDLLKKLSFENCLDAGCAQAYLLNEIVHRFPTKGYGCDFSTQVIHSNRLRFPECEFAVVDLENGTWPDNKCFDLVVCSEVIEHIEDWQRAVSHIASMAKRYLVLTVPRGNVRKIDKIVGHHRHFEGEELRLHLKQHGFECLRIIRHGFPVHSFYKRAINFLAPEKIYDLFQGKKDYSFFQKCLSHVIYVAFYLNYLFSSGGQLFILAERQHKKETT